MQGGLRCFGDESRRVETGFDQLRDRLSTRPAVFCSFNANKVYFIWQVLFFCFIRANDVHHMLSRWLDDA